MTRTPMVAALLLALGSSSATGQDAATLRATKTFRCAFTTSASVNMDTDTPKVSTHTDKLELVFDQIDSQKRTGRLIGNVGSEDVTVIAGNEKITLLEATPTGTIQVTVIYAAQQSDKQFKAVHSRHTAVLGGIPLASQMYGACRALL